MRNMDLHPTKAVLPDGTIMSGNVLRRNIFYYRDPEAKLYQAPQRAARPQRSRTTTWSGTSASR